MTDSGTSGRVLVPGFVAGTWIQPRSSLQVPGTHGARPRSVVLGQRFIETVESGPLDLGTLAWDDPAVGVAHGFQLRSRRATGLDSRPCRGCDSR